MQDLTDVLGELRDTDAELPADADTVAADVARGRRALAGRRHRRIAVAGVVAAAAVAAVTVGTAGQSGRSGPDAAPRRTPVATRHAPAATRQAPRLQLTAYTGVQPTGFRVETVPAGWRVVSSDAYAFVAVPPGGNPHQRPGDFRNGIAVMLQGQSRLPPTSAVTKVTVNGRPGQLGLTADKLTKWLIFSDGSGHKVLVQVFTDIGLTDDQIVRFAQGITVTGDVRAPVG